MYIQATIFAVLVAFSLGCKDPEVNAHSYTTKEDVSSSKTLVIVQFAVTCKDGPPPSSLYVEVGDKSLLAAKSPDGLTFQASWSDEHRKIGAGNYKVRIYDESGYSDMRKAQRAGEKSDSVRPLAEVDVNHGGVWKGSWVAGETVACVGALVLLWFAYNKKSQISA